MGSADIIPGVSGGTVALITGIYEDLINAIKSLNLLFIFYFFKGFLNKSYFKKSKENFVNIKFRFLVPIICGIALAFILLANVLGHFLENYPTYTYAFFLGLILSSAIFVFKINNIKLGVISILFILLGFLFGFFVVGLQSIQTEHTVLIVFLSGIITFCAMILPGLSGAFILLFLGQYEFLLGVLRSITRFDFSNIVYAISYAIGGVIGIIAFSQVLSYLIKNHRIATLSFVIGIMIGALRKPGEIIYSSNDNLFIVSFSLIFGILIVTIFYFYEIKIKKAIKI